MKIISWNVNGIRSVYRKGFLQFINKEDPDIFCLQEIKATEIPSPDLFSENNEDKYKIFLNYAEKPGYSGVAVYTKNKPKKVVKNLGLKRFDQEGRLLEVHFKDFILINLYIPHGGRGKENLSYKLQVYQKLLRHLKNKKGERIILTGDFNIAHTEIDLARPNGNNNNIMFTREERIQIDKLLEIGFIDSFRMFESGGGYYSWWPYRRGLRERNIGWRIDYIFVSNNLKTKIKDSFILKDAVGSDHCPAGIIL